MYYVVYSFDGEIYVHECNTKEQVADYARENPNDDFKVFGTPPLCKETYK